MIDAVKLIEYNTWANTKIAEQIKLFSDEQFTKESGGSFPSIRLTLLHLLSSDWTWMHRLKGIPLIDVPGDWITNTAVEVCNYWLPVQYEMIALVNEIAATPDKEISFITRKGAAYTLPFSDIIIHITNHGTYHRGQVVNMIRMLGETPVNTDYFIFCTLPGR